jgi:hypothetical protein
MGGPLSNPCLVTPPSHTILGAAIKSAIISNDKSATLGRLGGVILLGVV